MLNKEMLLGWRLGDCSGVTTVGPLLPLSFASGTTSCMNTCTDSPVITSSLLSTGFVLPSRVFTEIKDLSTYSTCFLSLTSIFIDIGSLKFYYSNELLF